MAKRCMSPSCYVTVRDGTSRCEIHTRTQKKQQQDNRKFNPETQKIYNTKRWRRTSEKYRVINPLCERCLEEDIETYADVVDHIKELSDGGEAYNFENLMSLCHSCHNMKTKNEVRKRLNSDKNIKNDIEFI
jgi:5-methylcytosine-specific restriction protein A